MNVLIRIDATINSQAHEKRKEKLRLSKKKKCTQRTSLDCTQARLRHPKSGATTHTQAHTQSKTHICLCTCGVGGWVRGCYGQVGRKVVCWCIDMLGEVRVYTHICVRM